MEAALAWFPDQFRAFFTFVIGDLAGLGDGSAFVHHWDVPADRILGMPEGAG